MDKSRLIRTIVIPLLIGTLATGLVSWYVKNEEKRYSPSDLVPVLVATRALPARTAIVQDMVKVKSIPRAYAPPNILSKPDEAVGKVTTVAFSDGEPITSSRLTQSERVMGLSRHIPAGMRAVTIAVNEITGNAAFPEPGDRIDILATFTKEIGGRDRTDLVLENIGVLAIVRDTEVKAGSAIKDMKSYTSLTLAVTPGQAATLVWSEERGKLRILLRPEGSKDQAGRAAADSSSVLGYQPATPKSR